jgi:prepilin-type processing-associated H-X9-DG protein
VACEVPIIAILAAILFPVFAQAREKARMSGCLSNMRQLGTSPCAEGWVSEPGRGLPISYAMNGCATTWYPADGSMGKEGIQPPVREASIVRAAETILIGEQTWGTADIHPDWTWLRCNGLMTHLKYPGPGGNANFIFVDGHAKNMKWSQTLFPLHENKWELQPDPNPNNRRLKGPPGCDYVVPSSWVCTGTKTEMTRPDQLQ